MPSLSRRQWFVGHRTLSAHKMNEGKAVHWLHWSALVVALPLTLGVVTPHLVSAYHLEAGDRAPDNPELWAYNPLPALNSLRAQILYKGKQR